MRPSRCTSVTRSGCIGGMIVNLPGLRYTSCWKFSKSDKQFTENLICIYKWKIQQLHFQFRFLNWKFNISIFNSYFWIENAKFFWDFNSDFWIENWHVEFPIQKSELKIKMLNFQFRNLNWICDLYTTNLSQNMVVCFWKALKAEVFGPEKLKAAAFHWMRITTWAQRAEM